MKDNPHKIIKLTTPWMHPFFYSHTPKNLGIIGNYKFEIDNDCKICDYWVIWGGLNPNYKSDTVLCPKENIIFITDEVHTDRRFYQSFLNQFSVIVTPRTDIQHKHIINYHELNTWHLNKTFDELFSENEGKKTKDLCAISSDLTILNGHKNRYAFINKLIGHFKDRLDVFGRGFKPFNDKYIVLQPYKYSIAIENTVNRGYFTEKISECFLAQTMPIYYGCPNISEYFNSDAIIKIDINDYKKSIEIIEKAIEENLYEKNISKIIEQKRKYLNDLDFFSGVTKLVENQFSNSLHKEKNKILAEYTFERFHHLHRIIEIINNRNFISNKMKFTINLHDKGKFSGNY